MELMVARTLLAGMFTLAVVAKARDRSGVRQAVIAFGVPMRVAGLVGGMLVGIEIAIVVLLAFTPSARVGAAAAAAILSVFSAAIATNLWRGRAPECHCFGRVSSSPVGWPNVARNGLFATLAVFITIGGRLSWLLAAVAVGMGTLWLRPMRKALWTKRFDVPAPDFALVDQHGQAVTLDALVSRGLPVILVFTQTGCAACDALMPDVARWQHELTRQVTVALINGGPGEHSHECARAHQLESVLVDDRRLMLTAYGVTATPSAVLITPGRARHGEPARGAREIHELIERTVLGHPGSDLSRRRILGRVAAGFAAVTVLPSASALGTKTAAADTGPDGLEVDGAWLCNQTFALCTTAPCEPSPTDPGVAVCHCVMENGYSIGYKACTERAQVGTAVASSFSTVNVNANFAVLSCPSGVPWANCLDMPCEIDPVNPALATCQCQVVTTGESLTFGGGCDTATCTSTIWSAATPDLPGAAQYTKGMKQLNQPVTFPESCPAT
ncbi:hypothetical protein BH09ACT8_BH09ACT8_37360 [soil metagenome]